VLKEDHTCVGKFMKYCETARLIREVCYNRESVSEGVLRQPHT
jgi:hypothetical protein